MQINLAAVAIVSGVLGFIFWALAARCRTDDARRPGRHWKPGMYLRSKNFTAWGNVWRWLYILFNGLAVIAVAALVYINVT